MTYGETRGTPEDFEAFADPGGAPRTRLPRRIDLSPERSQQGLVKLALSIVELLRQLVEKQALRRIEGGGLDAAQVERLGTTLMRLERQMAELKEHFGIEDLDIDLGPLGPLLDDATTPPPAPAGRVVRHGRARGGSRAGGHRAPTEA